MTKPAMPLTPEVLVPRVGHYLVEKKIITEQELQQALDRQKDKNLYEAPPLLGQVLMDMNLINRQILDEAVTEQIIQLRSALQDANNELEARVRKRTIELQEALNRLSELDKLKSNFVSNISHELRTPLTHIKGYLDLLLAGDLGLLADEQQQVMEVMNRATDRLEHLINDLILFSTIDRGNLVLDLQPVEIADTCKEIIQQMSLVAETKKIRLTIKFPPLLQRVVADPEKIFWVVRQLMDNAIKFTPSGGEITIHLSQRDKNVWVTISDTGIGIPADYLDDIFEPFYQLDSAANRKYSGTGLGLALVKEIIEAHGGHIHVTSEPEKGSNFSFSLELFSGDA